CIGRLTYYKGQEHLIRALRHVIGVRLLIVGAGEQRRRLAGIIAELQLADRAVLAGELTHLDLHALIETCHCLCLPSMERTEAFGMVLLEAMAHKKPVVACDVPGSGMAWVVQDGKTGRIVPPGDSEALATVLQTFSSDHNTMAAMGYAGWLRYRQLFGIDVIGQQIREVYDEAIVGGAQ
ncbi:MAG: glycosyltransferase, partial [Nitrosospira sp.]|nr:glycosyltransferase [Nitrosospira sp.]